MMIRKVDFTKKGIYLNRQGEFTILDMKKQTGMMTILQEGKTKTVDMNKTAMIHNNILNEKAKENMGIKEQSSQGNFAWTLGAILSIGRFSAQIGYSHYDRFINRYTHSTKTSIGDVPHVHRYNPNSDKPGIELTIVIPRNLLEHDRFKLPTDVVPNIDKRDQIRINRNEFWWKLVEEYGFRLTTTKQNIDFILGRIPEDMKDDFLHGIKDFS